MIPESFSTNSPSCMLNNRHALETGLTRTPALPIASNLTARRRFARKPAQGRARALCRMRAVEAAAVGEQESTASRISSTTTEAVISRLGLVRTCGAFRGGGPASAAKAPGLHRPAVRSSAEGAIHAVFRIADPLLRVIAPSASA
jgi:hypothetical protein